MSLIVAGRFDTFPVAERAAQRLFDAGFHDEDVTVFFVNPRGMHDQTPIGGDQAADPGARAGHKGAAVGVILGAALGGAAGVVIAHWTGVLPLLAAVGAGVGAYLGSLAGTMTTVRSVPSEAPAVAPRPRESGVLLAVHVTDATQVQAAQVLREAGAQDVERAVGRWAQGRWSDFNPTQAPVPAPGLTTGADLRHPDGPVV